MSPGGVYIEKLKVVLQLLLNIPFTSSTLVVHYTLNRGTLAAAYTLNCVSFIRKGVPVHAPPVKQGPSNSTHLTPIYKTAISRRQ